jgi:hypothetical protein
MAESKGWMRCAALCAALLVTAGVSGAYAEGYPKLSMYVEGGPHLEGRDLVGRFVNADATACIDYLVWDWFDLYAGLRIGVYGETVATAYMAADLARYYPVDAGAEVYFLLPTALSRDLVWTCSLTTDTFIYLDSVHLNPSDYQPSFWYVEVYLGLRYYIMRNLHVEVRAAGGTMPLFQDLPAFAGARLAVGLDF